MNIWIGVRKKEVVEPSQVTWPKAMLLTLSSFRSKTVTEGNSINQFL